MASVSQGLPADVNRGPGINLVAWIGFSISTFFIAVRLFSRFKLLQNAGWSDAVMVLSWLLNLVTRALSSAAVSQGLGRHIEYVDADSASRVLYYAAILQPIGIAAYTVPKLAVVILIISLMGPKKSRQWFLHSIIAVLYITSALSAIFIFAQCDPPSHFWHPTEPANCMSPLVLQRITLFAGSWSAFVDLSLALFPITIFWDLQMKLQKKIGISCLMGLGVLAMISAIIKTTNLPEEQNPDFTYAFFDLLVWTFIETDAVIVCACVPFFPRVFGYFKKQEYRSKGCAPTSPYSNARGNLATKPQRVKTGYTTFGSLLQDDTTAANEHYELGAMQPQRSGIVKTVQIEQTHDFV